MLVRLVSSLMDDSGVSLRTLILEFLHVSSKKIAIAGRPGISHKGFSTTPIAEKRGGFFRYITQHLYLPTPMSILSLMPLFYAYITSILFF